MLEGGGCFLYVAGCFLMRQVLFLTRPALFLAVFSLYASGFVSSELPFGFTFRGHGFWVRLTKTSLVASLLCHHGIYGTFLL